MFYCYAQEYQCKRTGRGPSPLHFGGDLEPDTAVGAGLERRLHNVWRTDTSCGFHLGKPGVHILRHTGTDKHIHEHPFYERKKCSVKRTKHHPKVHCAQHIPTCPLPTPGKAAARGSSLVHSEGWSLQQIRHIQVKAEMLMIPWVPSSGGAHTVPTPSRPPMSRSLRAHVGNACNK